MRVSYEHVIPASVDKIMEAFLDDEFYIKKQLSLGAVSVDILEREALSDSQTRFKIRIKEPTKLPAIIRKPDEVDEFTNISTIDTQEKKITWHVTPAMGADRLFLKGFVEFHDQGDETRVVYIMDLEVKIPIIGSKVEKFALSKTEGETAKQAEFLKKWVAK